VARNAGHEFFGTERLHQAILTGGHDADSILRSIVATLTAHEQGAVQADDQCVIVCSRTL